MGRSGCSGNSVIDNSAPSFARCPVPASAILYPTRGLAKMCLESTASSPSLRRSRFTTLRTGQSSPTRSAYHTANFSPGSRSMETRPDAFTFWASSIPPSRSAGTGIGMGEAAQFIRDLHQEIRFFRLTDNFNHKPVLALADILAAFHEGKHFTAPFNGETVDDAFGRIAVGNGSVRYQHYSVQSLAQQPVLRG